MVRRTFLESNYYTDPLSRNYKWNERDSKAGKYVMEEPGACSEHHFGLVVLNDKMYQQSCIYMGMVKEGIVWK